MGVNRRISFLQRAVITLEPRTQIIKKFKKIVTVRGSNPGGGEIFQCPFSPALWLTQPSFAVSTVSFPEVKRLGHGAYNLPTSSAEVTNRSELCLRLICVHP